jgi:hypothetical protein
VVLTDAEDVEPDFVSQLDLFKQLLHASRVAERSLFRGVESRGDKTIHSDLHAP